MASPFVELEVGERIVKLERDLAERSRALRQDAPAAAAPAEGTNRLGPGAVEIVRAIQNPLDELTDYLTALRRELSAVRNARTRTDAGTDFCIGISMHLPVES